MLETFKMFYEDITLKVRGQKIKNVAKTHTTKAKNTIKKKRLQAEKLRRAKAREEARYQKALKKWTQDISIKAPKKAKRSKAKKAR